MSWVDHIKTSQVRQCFQALVTDLKEFHKVFPNPKYAKGFTALATCCHAMMEVIFADTAPAVEQAANLINSFNTSLSVLFKMKEGSAHKDLFNEAMLALKEKADKLGAALKTDLEPQKRNKDEKSEQNKPKTTALTTVLPREWFEEAIDSLMISSLDVSFRSVIGRSFFRHPVAMYSGFAEMTMAIGSIAQTGLGFALDALDVSIKQPEAPLDGIVDERVLMPAGLLLLSVVSFGYAFCKSYGEKAKQVRQAVEEYKIDVDDEKGSLNGFDDRSSLLGNNKKSRCWF